MKINNVIICGLGALGLTYANKLKNVCNLKILANPERIENYRKKIPSLNGENILLDYITPDERWKTDLIIITTKSSNTLYSTVIHSTKPPLICTMKLQK